jgi:hypothetical protein
MFDEMREKNKENDGFCLLDKNDSDVEDGGNLNISELVKEKEKEKEKKNKSIKQEGNQNKNKNFDPRSSEQIGITISQKLSGNKDVNDKNTKEETKKLRRSTTDKKFKTIENLFYSYTCVTNSINLVSYIYVGTKTTKIDVILKNDGTLEWPEDTTKLIFEKKSEIKGNEIILKPQKKDEEQKYSVELNNLGNLDEGEYKAEMRFQINDNRIGDKMILRIKIKKKEDPNEEMNNHMQEILQLREEYTLGDDQYTNEDIFKALKDSGFEIEQAFMLLIGD